MMEPVRSLEHRGKLVVDGGTGKGGTGKAVTVG